MQFVGQIMRQAAADVDGGKYATADAAAADV